MLRKLWSNFVSLIARMAGLRQERAHHFYHGALGASSLVVDLGTHKGEFSRFVTAEYGCSVLGLEANPHLYEVLPTLPRARFMNLAISREDSPVVFNVSDNVEASSVIEEMAQSFGSSTKVTVAGITLDSLFDKNIITSVDLLKVDIESSEFQMLEMASSEALTKAAQITVEFHLKAGSKEYSAERVMTISKRLGQLGFRTFVMDRDYTDVLFLNPNRIPLKFTQRIALAIYSSIIMPARMLTKK